MKKGLIFTLLILLGIMMNSCSSTSGRYVSDGTKIVIPCEDADDDNDGVSNFDDECPNTPAGATVNELGCMIDGDDDNDGVLNSVDKCPNTPADKIVDKYGCMIDGDDDNDGVLNSVDECPDTIPGKKVDKFGCMIDGDSDNDGVPNSIDECPNTLPDKEVDKYGCMIDGDDDNDGVANSIDACPNTPIGVKKVDEVGCMKEMNLNINFANKSYYVEEKYRKKIDELVKFLKANENYDVKIVGYTDSVGKRKNNLKLSQKRAEAVRELIINSGISPQRVEALGMGEANPIASNATSEGRALNRRIEAELIKK